MFELPDRWHICADTKNRKIINNWKIKQPLNDDLFENPNYTHVNSDGGGTIKSDAWGIELTIEQFKEYVLGRKPKKQKSVKEDTSYLINFLKQNNIT